MVRRPAESNAFEFSVMSSLRAAQLMLGCTPSLEGVHKATTMAQMEVAAGKVHRVDDPAEAPEPLESTKP